MKKVFIILGSLVLVATLTFPAFGYGSGKGKGCGGDCEYGRGKGACWEEKLEDLDITDEQKEQLKTLHEQFFTDTQELRETMRTKRQEMRTLMKGDTVDESEAMALQSEIHDLRGQMMEKRMKLQLESREIAPELKSFHGRKHGRGHGRHKAHGCSD